MSRRRGEFEHRTSIFEGAFRAWSHLGGCSPESLATTAPADLDPLSHPHDPTKDPRQQHTLTSSDNIEGSNTNNTAANGDATNGDDSTASDDDKKTDKPTSSSPAPQLTTEDIVYPYEPLPRNGIQHPFVQAIITPWLGAEADQDDIRHGITTLRTWWQHRRKGESISAKLSLGTTQMKGVVKGYTRHFFNLAHCMVVHDKEKPPKSLCGKLAHLCSLPSYCNSDVEDNDNNGISIEQQTESTDVTSQTNRETYNRTYDDPTKTPIIFISNQYEIHVAIKISGLSCLHCVKIVETVILGPHGTRSPIEGILDAIADSSLSFVLIKIADVISAKRICHEVGELMNLVGYEIEVKDVDICKILTKIKSREGINNDDDDDDDDYIIEINKMLYEAFIDGARTSPDLVDWSLPCLCPDDGILPGGACSRHCQMDNDILKAFDSRFEEVMEKIGLNENKRKYNNGFGYETEIKKQKQHDNKKDQMEDLSPSPTTGIDTSDIDTTGAETKLSIPLTMSGLNIPMPQPNMQYQFWGLNQQQNPLQMNPTLNVSIGGMMPQQTPGALFHHRPNMIQMYPLQMSAPYMSQQYQDNNEDNNSNKKDTNSDGESDEKNS